MKAGVLCAGLLAACGPRPAPRPYAPPEPEDLVDAVRRHSSLVRSVRAEARVDHRGREGRLKATILLVAERPDRLRLDALSPFGTPVASLAADGRAVGFFDRDAGRFFRGPVHACTLAWLVRFPLGPADAVEVLLGGVPLLEADFAEASWDARARQEVVRGTATDGSWQVLRLAGPVGRWTVRASEIYDPYGRMRLRVEHEEWRPVGDVEMPRSTHVTDGDQADVRIAYRSQDLNPSLPASVFGTGAPPGVTVEETDCR